MSGTVRKVPIMAPVQRLLRVAAYARVSCEKDAMLRSLSAQVSYYSNLIQSNTGWLYVGVYADEAQTGTKDTREDFQRLINDCRTEKIDMVITKSISRFARNTVTLLETVREFKQLGIDVFFEEQNIHTASADGELMLSILASYAQEESLSVSENCKWYWRQRMKEGHMVGLRRMFGYDIERGVITINPSEAAVVRRVFADYIAGKPTKDISRWLISKDVPTVNGGTWTTKRVRELLKNEKYTGDSLFQKKYVVDHLTKKLVHNHGELAQYFAEDTHEAIIACDTLEQARTLMAEHAHKSNIQKQTTARYPFSGLIVCGNCGKHFIRKTTNGRISWQCVTFQLEGKDACPAKQIPEPTLQAACAEVLGIPTFEECIFKQRVEHIEVPGNNRLRFVFKDGSAIESTWADRSRSNSWTDEMKAEARKKSLAYRREQQCQK